MCSCICYAITQEPFISLCLNEPAHIVLLNFKAALNGTKIKCGIVTLINAY